MLRYVSVGISLKAMMAYNLVHSVRYDSAHLNSVVDILKMFRTLRLTKLSWVESGQALWARLKNVGLFDRTTLQCYVDYGLHVKRDMLFDFEHWLLMHILQTLCCQAGLWYNASQLYNAPECIKLWLMQWCSDVNKTVPFQTKTKTQKNCLKTVPWQT